jgi:hypothetical protein
MQVSPVGQPPMHWPPQPFDAPQSAPGGQTGMQQPVGVQVEPGAHGPSQNPPQPSGVPQTAPGGQLGAHSQL